LGRDWVVEVVGVGRGVGEGLAYAGAYRMWAPFFTYATNVAAAGPVVFVKVPTAKLSVAALNDCG